MAEFSLERCSDRLRDALGRAAAASQDDGVILDRHVLHALHMVHRDPKYLDGFAREEVDFRYQGPGAKSQQSSVAYSPSRRDHFAAAVISVLVQKGVPGDTGSIEPCDIFAEAAMQIADALIAALDRTEASE